MYGEDLMSSLAPFREPRHQGSDALSLPALLEELGDEGLVRQAREDGLMKFGAFLIHPETLFLTSHARDNWLRAPMALRACMVSPDNHSTPGLMCRLCRSESERAARQAVARARPPWPRSAAGVRLIREAASDSLAAQKAWGRLPRNDEDFWCARFPEGTLVHRLPVSFLDPEHAAAVRRTSRRHRDLVKLVAPEWRPMYEWCLAKGKCLAPVAPHLTILVSGPRESGWLYDMSGTRFSCPCDLQTPPLRINREQDLPRLSMHSIRAIRSRGARRWLTARLQYEELVKLQAELTALTSVQITELNSTTVRQINSVLGQATRIEQKVGELRQKVELYISLQTALRSGSPGSSSSQAAQVVVRFRWGGLGLRFLGLNS